jgi:hypothetical protein
LAYQLSHHSADVTILSAATLRESTAGSDWSSAAMSTPAEGICVGEEEAILACIEES